MCFQLSQKHLVGEVVTKEKIDEAAAVYEAHLGPGLFNYDGKYKYTCTVEPLYTRHPWDPYKWPD